MRKESLTILLFFFFALTLNAQDNLIKNGQFVKGTDNWEVLLNDANKPIKAHIEQSTEYKAYGLADNYVGTNFVELDEQSAIQQKVETSKDRVYELSFAVAHRPEAGNKQLIVAINGKAIHTQTIKNKKEAGNFIYKTVRFMAKGNETKLAFYSASLDGAADKGILLTDIMCKATDVEDLDKYSEIKY